MIDAAPGRIVGALIMAYLAYVVLFALAPFTLSVDTSDSIGALFLNKFEGLSGLSRVTPWDVWTNIVFFIPFGLLLVLLPRVAMKAWYSKILLAFFAAALLSSTIEIAQLFYPRAPSLADIIYNVLGSVIGAIMGTWVHTVHQLHGGTWLHRFRTRAALTLILTGYLVFLVVAMGLPLPLAHDFSNWDPTSGLFLGNEGSLDRPWRGAIYLVALYDRPLTPEEVSTHFSIGPFTGMREKRTDDGLVLYCEFSERTGDVVHDQAGEEVPIDLHIKDPSRVEWMTPNGLMLFADAVVTSPEPPEKLTHGRLTHNQLSVEAWVSPADLAQTGPARIVSYSINIGERNFTLGQQNREVVFRLRTPASGVNGTRPALRTNDSPLSLGTQHLVATYSDGVERLYVNGQERAHALLRSQDSLSDIIVHRVGERFKWLVYSVLIFPLGMLSAMFYRHRRQKWVRLTSFVTALVGLSLIQVFRLLTFETSVDPLFMSVGASTVMLSVLLLPSFQADTSVLLPVCANHQDAVRATFGRHLS